MKLYIKRNGNTVPVSVSTSPEGPWHVIGDGFLALIATPAQIYNVNRLVDDARNNPTEEVEVSEDMWEKIKKAHNIK